VSKYLIKFDANNTNTDLSSTENEVYSAHQKMKKHNLLSCTCGRSELDNVLNDIHSTVLLSIAT